MILKHPAVAIAAMVGLVLTVGGCGNDYGNIAPVTGTVTVDGAPTADLMVIFVPEGGGGASEGRTDASGKYELSYLDAKGAVVGTHRVKVTAVRTAVEDTSALPTNIPSDDPRYQELATASYEQMSKEQSEPPIIIPERYNTKSELVKEVTEGNNVINLEITTK